MAATITAAAETSYLDPERLYTLQGFHKASGISKTRLREAKLRSIPLETLKVGKRIYVRGRDAISFVERLAAADAS